MAITETVTIINKSGKVISTGKHLINIFKDAKDAYNDKKAALHAEHNARTKHRNIQRASQTRDEAQSAATSRHSRSSRRSHKHRRERDGGNPSRSPLTEYNLSRIDEGSLVSSSRRSRKSTSHHGEGASRSLREGRVEYRAPYFENAGPSQISLVRRHTDFPTPLPFGPTETQITRSTLPPSYHTHELHRSSSVPDFHAQSEENIDMNLAYGPIPHHSSLAAPEEISREEVERIMSKLDRLLLEAHCIQHTASAMITNLQANPEAMAAVALTLAELSNLLAKMSPGIIASLKAGSPAIFALLASPQFLIAGGVALGVTIVMFGGYKIIKKIQANAEAKREASRLEQPFVFGPQAIGHQPLDFSEDIELGSIDSWRRGIAEMEAQSSSTSVDGEFITPEAAKQNKERECDRARHGRMVEEGSILSTRSRKTVRRVSSKPTLRSKDDTRKSPASKAPDSVSGSTKKSEKGKAKEMLMIEPKEKKPKKVSSSALMVLLKKGKKGRDDRESVLSLRPKTIEI